MMSWFKVVHEYESKLNQAIKHSDKSIEDQNKYLDHLVVIDNAVPKFKEDASLIDAYKRMRGMDPDTFWERALPRLQAYRIEIWSEVSRDGKNQKTE